MNVKHAPHTIRTSAAGSKMKFSRIIADPVVRERWEKVRRWFFLRESTYDMTNRCNIRCDGCYYYEGEKQFTKENGRPGDWRALMESEKQRGITYVVLAGAEPSLVPELCQTCYDVIPLGSIASNGFKRLPERVGYKIHISVWGNDDTSRRIRNAKDLLAKQIDNYRSDPRAVWVYTFTRENIDEIYAVMEALAGNGCRATFNMFSAPVGYAGPLRHDAGSLARTREVMLDILAKYPEHVLYSPYNAVAHTHRLGLHDLYACSYPRMNPSTDIGLGRSFRQYRTDLTGTGAWPAACRTRTARLPSLRGGSAVVTARLYRHGSDPEAFKGWLDYVDTYLAVWVMGYEKGKNLLDRPTPPPGFGL